MIRLFAGLIAFFLFVSAPQAKSELPFGEFRMMNTGGFTELNGERSALEADPSSATVHLTPEAPDNLMLSINDAEIRLFKLEKGLASLSWSAKGSSLLHSIDIKALFGDTLTEDIPAWGANVAWPGLGETQLVVFPLRKNAYLGFLVSYPGEKKVVRQMEFRRMFGPGKRTKSAGPSKAPLTN